MELDIVAVSQERRLRMWAIEQAVTLHREHSQQFMARDIVREAEHLEDHVREADYDKD